MIRTGNKIFAVLTFAMLAMGVEAADTGKELVDRFVSDVITLEARFEQALVDAEGAVVERSTGTLELERPGKFRWSYSEPYEQLLVADGTNVWSYDLDLMQVTVKPQGDVLANTPALLLGGSGDALSQFHFNGTSVEDGTTWVRMTPVDTSSGFERMELGFEAGALTRMVFFDNLQQTTLVMLYDVRTNEPIDADRFVFVVPEDADLVGTPAVADPI